MPRDSIRPRLIEMFERFSVKQKSQQQTNSLQSQQMYTARDDLKLREVFDALWEGKYIIIFITAVFLASGIGLALSAQEWWSSSAKITKSQPQDIAAYQQQVKQFQAVFNIYQEDGTVLVSKELNKLGDSQVLFQRFVNAFNSTNNKRAFLDNSSDFQSFKSNFFSESSEVSDDSVRRLYSEWFKRITAVAENKDATNSPYFVRFQTTTKKGSFNLLSSYILFTEEQIHRDAFNNLQASISGKKNELIQQKRMLETQAVSQLSVETERTKYAMGIARAANVDKPIQTGNDHEIFSIELGSKGLEAKVQALESIKNLSVIEPRLLQITAKLDMIDNLEIDRNVEFQTFRFLETVQQPITRDKPKRVVIVFISLLLGGLLSVVIVLVRFAFKKES